MADTAISSNLLKTIPAQTAQTTAKVPPQPTVQSLQKKEPTTQPVVNVSKEPKADMFVKNTTTGAVTGAAAGGLLGAFAFAKPMFKTVDEFLESPLEKLSQIKTKLPQNNEGIMVRGLIETKEQMEKSIDTLFKGGDFIGVEELKEIQNKHSVANSMDKISEILEKVKETCNNKEMSIGEFNKQIETTALDVLCTNPNEKEAALEKIKNIKIQMDPNMKIMVEDEIFEAMESIIKKIGKDAGEIEQSYKNLVENAKNGIVTKSEYKNVFSSPQIMKKMLLSGGEAVQSVMGEKVAANKEELMSIFDNAIKKGSPKLRKKPAIIGAVVLGAIGATVAALNSKAKAPTQKA